MDILGFDVPIWLILLVVVLILNALYTRRHVGSFRGTGIPEYSFSALVSMYQFHKQGLYELEFKRMKKYGKVYGYTDSYGPVVSVADTNMLKEIFVKQFNNFPDRRSLSGFNGDLECGILVLKGDHWKHVRNFVTPTFSTGKLRRMFPLIDRASNTMIKTLKDQLREGDEIEMRRLFGGYTMDVIAATAFGIEVDSQGNPDDPFVKHAKPFLEVGFAPWLLILVLFPFTSPFLKMLGCCLFPKSSQRFFRSTINKVMDERNEKRKDYVDFLELMKNAHEEQTLQEEQSGTATTTEKKGLTKEEIIAQAETFLAAGYDTTSILLTCFAYNLALYPDIQDKLREEIKTTFSEKPLNYDTIHESQYLEMCINESLRLYPPLLRLDRMCVRDTEVNGLKIKKGFWITISPYAIHHDPDVWENPETFDPNRFSSESKAMHNPYGFLPFGHGPRNCVGMRLAYAEAKLAIIKLVRDFKISVGSKTKIPPKFLNAVVMKPADMFLKIEEL